MPQLFICSEGIMAASLTNWIVVKMNILKTLKCLGKHLRGIMPLNGKKFS